MFRFIILVVVNFTSVILLASAFEISESAPLAAIAYLLNPLALPAEWVAPRWPAYGLLIVTSAFVLGPFVWAAVIESLLRWFVDRPTGSQANCSNLSNKD